MYVFEIHIDHYPGAKVNIYLGFAEMARFGLHHS